MPLPDPRHEVFARAIAMGLSPGRSSAAAGYSKNSKNSKRLAARPEIIARAAALRDEIFWGETSDVGPVINALMRLARQAETMTTAAAMAAARGLLAEAAKLKLSLDAQAYVREDALLHLPTMSKAEWVATYVRKG